MIEEIDVIGQIVLKINYFNQMIRYFGYGSLTFFDNLMYYIANYYFSGFFLNDE